MKRILIYGNRKEPTSYYDVSTPEREAGAYLAVFEKLDIDWQVYSELQETIPEPPKFPEGHPQGCFCDECKAVRVQMKRAPREEARVTEQRSLYERAKKGDARAARKLLMQRRDYEYEEIRIERVHEEEAEYEPVDEYGTPEKPCNEYALVKHGQNYLVFGLNHGNYSGHPRVFGSLDEAEKRFEGRRFKELKRPGKHPLIKEQYVCVGTKEHGAYGDDEKLVAQYPKGTVVVPSGKVRIFRMQTCETHEREMKRFE